MQAVLETVRLGEFQSLAVRAYTQPAFDAPWHFHPELELTLIREGVGERFVGDSIEPYGPGDLVLLGANLPHYWRSRLSTPGKKGGDRASGAATPSSAVVVHFRESLLGGDSKSSSLPPVPEFAGIRALLARAPRGVAFTRPDKTDLVAAMESLADMESEEDGVGAGRVIRFYEILHRLSREAEHHQRELASPAHLSLRNEKSVRRLNQAANFVFAHLGGPIRLEDVASAAGMGEAAFCRYFKRTTGRTLTQFIAELRVSEACKRLVESGDTSIAEIAFEAGFGSLSSFNKIFREQKGMSPREYRAMRGSRAGRKGRGSSFVPAP